MHFTGTSLLLFILPMVCIALTVAASVHDIITRTIPNSFALIVAAAGITIGVLSGHLLVSLLTATGVFVLASLCWRRGWMGGGDVKLLGAASLGMTPGSVLTFMAAVAIAGGFLAVFYLGAGRLVPVSASPRPAGLFARAMRVERWRIARGGPLPYACAIAAGALYVNISRGTL